MKIIEHTVNIPRTISVYLTPCSLKKNMLVDYVIFG